MEPNGTQWPPLAPPQADPLTASRPADGPPHTRAPSLPSPSPSHPKLLEAVPVGKKHQTPQLRQTGQKIFSQDLY